MRTHEATLAMLVVSSLACAGTSTGEDPKFTQADLAGDWRTFIVVKGSGGIGGVNRTTETVDQSGNVTYTSYQDTSGTTAPTGVKLTIAGDGTVTASNSPFGNAWGRMNSAKTIVVTTATHSGFPFLSVTQKVVPGVAYSLADVASSVWVYHQLTVGPAPKWEHGTATTGANGSLSLTDRVTSTGPAVDLPSFTTYSVTSDGVVSSSNEPTLVGMLSSDKSLLVTTTILGGGSFGFNVILRKGATYTQADAAGDWGWNNLGASTTSGNWSRGTLTVSPTGTLYFTSFLNSSGSNVLPASFGVVLAPDGVMTKATDPSYNGFLSPSKDFLVRTLGDPAAIPATFPSMSIWIR
jgi:hypothetical protein